jgi:hypothetical protein
VLRGATQVKEVSRARLARSMGRSSQRVLMFLNARSFAVGRLAEGEAWTGLRSGVAGRASEDTPTAMEVHPLARRPLSEEDRIILWRAEELQRAGFRPVIANALAAQKGVDLHLAVDLVKSGCPHDTAIRILL